MELSNIIRRLIEESVARLEKTGIANPQLDASILLAEALEMPREQLLLNPHKTVEKSAVERFDAFIARRAKNEPVAYIIGKKEFWSLDFNVTRDTLIPRPDSETLVEAALERAGRIAHKLNKPRCLKDIDILDIGTGTGCLIIALLKELPSARGTGADISEPALKVAEGNARYHEVDGRAQFIKSNWFEKIDRTFDLIISNPPYIAESERDHVMKDVAGYEPHLALFSGADGMDSYRAISNGLHEKLKSGGYALLEVGMGQAQKVAEILEKDGLVVDEVRSDLAGIPRCVIAYKKN